MGDIMTPTTLYFAVAVWVHLDTAELIIPHPVPLDVCEDAARTVIGDGAQGWCLPIIYERPSARFSVSIRR